MRPTTELPPLQFDVPSTLEEMLSGGSSPAGWSAISEYLTCPEKTRLRTLGIRRIPRQPVDNLVDELSATGFGTLMHTVLAIRPVYGSEVASAFLAESPIAKALHPIDQQKAQAMLRVYETEYPLENEPWEYIGVETTVVTDIGGGALRSVRYDKLVRMKRDHALFSLEHKTASRQGTQYVASYTPQMLVQQTLWNKNPHLVAKYGRMQGVFIDQLVKTQIPKCERLGPYLFDRWQEDQMVDTLKLADTMYESMVVAPDGSWPKFRNNCWGRFGACEYLGLCWDNAVGDYEQVKR